MDNEIIHIQTMPEVVTVIPRMPDQNPAFVYLASLSAKSGRVTQQQVIGVMAKWLGGTIDSIDWSALRYAHTVALKTKILEAGYSPASTRKFIAAIRGTLKAAWRLGQMSAEDFARAIDLGKVSGTSLPAGRYVQDEEIGRLFDACRADITITGARDAAIIAVLYGCGLRRHELIDLVTTDYNAADGTLAVHGKRGRERIVYVTNGTADALNDWMVARSNYYGPIFLAIYKGRRIRHHLPISTQAVYEIVRERLKQAGLEVFSPHSLRRSFCSKLLDQGVDIVTVSKMAGHANVQTTAMYDRRPGEAQRSGAAMINVPYKRREPQPQAGT